TAIRISPHAAHALPRVDSPSGSDGIVGNRSARPGPNRANSHTATVHHQNIARAWNHGQIANGSATNHPTAPTFRPPRMRTNARRTRLITYGQCAPPCAVRRIGNHSVIDLRLG